MLQSQIYRSSNSICYGVNAWFDVVIDKDIIYSLEAIKFNIIETIPKDITDNKLRLINCIIKNINKKIKSKAKFVNDVGTDLDKLVKLSKLHEELNYVVSLEFVKNFLKLYKTIVSNQQEKDECVIKALENSKMTIEIDLDKIVVEYKYTDKVKIRFTHED